MASNLPTYTLRVAREYLDKISYIAKSHGRSSNKEIEQLIKEYILQYEADHGEIKLDES